MSSTLRYKVNSVFLHENRLESDVADLGKLLIFFGVILTIVGVALVLLGRTNLPVGRLPGDIVYRGRHTTFYFPIVTCIILSIALTLLMYVIGRFRH